MTACHDLYPADTGAASATVTRDERIVVGVDGSASSVAALRWAARQAHGARGRVEAVMVYAPAPAMYFAVGGYPAVNPVDATAVRNRARAMLEQTVGTALGSTDDIQLVVIGDQSPAKTLTRLAQGAAMLVVGAHRHTTLGLMLGSTATACVRHAVSPVVVVPAAEPSAEADDS